MSVSLHIGPSFPAAWESLVLPWFEQVALSSLASSQPVAVVTPFPSAAAFLRSKLLDHEIPLLGVKFITPAQLRELILGRVAETLPLREHLRLLLTIAAESIANSEDAELNAIARSISRAPDNLLRVFDQVGATGWSFDDVATPVVREIAQTFQRLVKSCGFELVHEADRGAIEYAKATTPVFNALLLIGFTSAHWPLWSLLQASVLSARHAAVVLEYPREQTRTVDETWIGTWEQTFGAAEPISEADRNRPFVGLVRSSDETPEPAVREKVQFFVGLNSTEQAEAITAAALDFLGDTNFTRLGILFPRTGALPRLVSELLAAANIPHHDGIGHLTPGEFEHPSWNAWLDLQERHQLEPLLQFFELHPESLSELQIEIVRQKLRRAYSSILIDDINVLREYCRQRSDDAKFAALARLLEEISFLPARATLKVFLAKTKAIFAKLKWNARWSTIDQLARTWPDKVPLDISRAGFLNWLREITNSFAISRAAKADQRYSRVHLLSYSDAETHEWSHLILAGLNQGGWPPGNIESGFLFDSQIGELNRRALGVGKQGEGHSTIATGKTFLLGSEDERRIAIRRFAAAIESVEHRLALSASLLQESAPERFWNPSELLSQAYFAVRKAPLSQQTMSRLREQTHAWLDKQDVANTGDVPAMDVAQTRTAYTARRTAEVPFGEYEFALREPIKREITLRATEWDKVVKTPALIWLKAYLGVENQEPDLNQWNAATGTWVHDWLAEIADVEQENVFVRFPTPKQATDRFARAGQKLRTQVVELCATAGRPVPDWWLSGWANAFAVAGCLASKLAEVEGCSYLATEWALNRRESVSLGDDRTLRLGGRIDLILAQTAPKNSQLTGLNLWIVDYKTGAKKSLSASGKTPETRAANLRKRLVRGDAIQLGLYGLAARELGAAEVDLSILSLRTELDKPQLKLTDLIAFADFWQELYRLQQEGVFGLRGPIRNEFGFNPDYPLATLPIDKEFLDEKWVLTHPAFADDEDDWS
jgi:hypothetical protein